MINTHEDDSYIRGRGSAPVLSDRVDRGCRSELTALQTSRFGGCSCMAGNEHEGAVLALSTIEEIRLLDPDGTAGLLHQLVELFNVKTEDLLRKPCWSEEPWDLRSVGRIAHSMKSSSSAVGAEKLSALCGDLERHICEGQAVDVRQYHVEIRFAFVEAAEALNRFLEATNSR
jgi:HPt (histidine-containing phosphotransfer) domain-containing protein